MPKRKNILRPVEKRINLPEDLVAQVDLLLFSELEGKVPFGAWSKFVEPILREEVNRRLASINPQEPRS